MNTPPQAPHNPLEGTGFQSLMALETHEAPAAVTRMIAANTAQFVHLGNRLRELAPPFIVTCARGSSDHAATYLKYLVEITCGIPVVSIGPSISSVYHAPMKLKGAALIAISQSGASPDIIALQQTANEAGALTIALVNQENSQLGNAADFVIPLSCGPENSVAATKSMISSCAAAAAIAAELSQNRDLLSGVLNLPQTLQQALQMDWSLAIDSLLIADSMFVLGRGPAYAMACEAALKMKETAALHAEAYSIAEVMHGPLQLVNHGYPVLSFVPDDQAAKSSQTALQKLLDTGANLFCATQKDMPGRQLATVSAGHGLLDPIAMIQSFYVLAEKLARARGHNPDTPSNLRKVTRTI